MTALMKKRRQETWFGRSFRRLGTYTRETSLIGVHQSLFRALHLFTCIFDRDLKPENLLLGDATGKTPVVKVADFGLSKIVDQEQMNTACGTPAYVGTSVFQVKCGSGSLFP